MNCEAAKLTKWKLIPVKMLLWLKRKTLSEEQKVSIEDVDMSKMQDEVCSICYCELYDDLKVLSDDQVDSLNSDQLSHLKAIPVVQMSECNGHFYHSECLE